MLCRFPILALLALASALPAQAQSDDGRSTIMRPEQPEPWLPPKYRSPRGTRQHVRVPHHAPALTAKVPPPIIAPETGRALPNLPTLSPSGPHGSETFQDRAARCAQQAGVYGQDAGNRNAYVGTCINQ